MARTEKLVNFDQLRSMLNDGMSMGECAEYFGLDGKQLREQCLKYGFNQMEDPTTRQPLQQHEGDLLLSWDEIEEYLATGLSIAEVATAAGVDETTLRESYVAHATEIKFDTLDTWAGVLRARRHYQLIKSIETRALNGDLRAYIALSKILSSRHPDSIKAISGDKQI